MSTWRYFKLEEFDCKGTGRNEMNHEFITLLDEMRHELGFPFIISSGYRAPEHNVLVSGTGPDGPHTTGLAADIRVYGERAYDLVDLATSRGVRGIGIQQKGAWASRFIHLDMVNRPRRTIWSY